MTISAEAMRQSDLLAFELAIEKGQPGSVMCSYNLINGRWGCENDYLLNKVLKHDWGFKGFVMSDWGAVHSTAGAANDGLDQFTGFCCVDRQAVVRAAGDEGRACSRARSRSARLDDMVERILWALFAKGAVDDPVEVGADRLCGARAVSQKAAEESLVLLKNDGDLLPLRGVKSIAVIGGNADKGVMAGGGSSDVTPVGGAVMIDNHTFMPSPPLDAAQARAAARPDQLRRRHRSGGRRRAGGRSPTWRSSSSRSTTARAMTAGSSWPAIRTRWSRRSPRPIRKRSSWSKAAARCSCRGRRRCRRSSKPSIPASAAAPAIARILTGKVNPSGHLPISFPASPEQLAHPVLPGLGLPNETPAAITYDEGAAIGYKWYDAKGFKPLFSFGHGLSYTGFALSEPDGAAGRRAVRVSFSIRNVGKRAGKGVAQVYVAPADWKKAGWEAPKRLGAFAKADLKPGQTKRIELTRRSAPACDLRGGRQQLAHQGRRVSPDAWRSVRRPDAERGRDPARQRLERQPGREIGQWLVPTFGTLQDCRPRIGAWTRSRTTC